MQLIKNKKLFFLDHFYLINILKELGQMQILKNNHPKSPKLPADKLNSDTSSGEIVAVIALNKFEI